MRFQAIFAAVRPVLPARTGRRTHDEESMKFARLPLLLILLFATLLLTCLTTHYADLWDGTTRLVTWA